jgi:hypothetical protein
MRLIAWLLAFANIGFFAWFGFYAPPLANTHYAPPLPSDVKTLTLLHESEAPDALASQEDSGAQPEAALDDEETLSTAEKQLAEEQAPFVGAGDSKPETLADAGASLTPAPEVLDKSKETPAGNDVAANKTSPPDDTADKTLDETIEKPTIIAAKTQTETARQLQTAAEQTSNAETAPATQVATDTPPASTDSIAKTPQRQATAQTDTAATPKVASQAATQTAPTMHQLSVAEAEATNQTALKNAALTRLTNLSQNVPTDFLATATPELKRIASKPEATRQPTAGQKPAAQAPVCLQAGPYRDKQSAQQVLVQLKAYTPTVEIFSKNDPKSKPGLIWVYLQPYPTRADAEFVSTMLTRANVVDHYIVSNQPAGFRHAISLGLYRNPAIAQARIAELQRKGYYNVRQQQRDEKQREFWLTVSASAKQSQTWLQRPAIFQQAQVSAIDCK